MSSCADGVSFTDPSCFSSSFVGPAIASIGVEATLLGAAALFAVVNAATLLTPSVTLLERRRAAGVHAGARPELT